MTEPLMDIYRQRVLDHSREPHNQRALADADRQVTGFNPLCGDKLTVFVSFDDDVIRDIAFEGAGCAISVASASMMTDALQGLPKSHAGRLIDALNTLFSDGTVPQDPRLQDTLALENIRAYPSRIKCATLAWTAAGAALADGAEGTEVTTE